MKKIFTKVMLIGALYYVLLLANACTHCRPAKTVRYNITGVAVSNILFDYQNDSTFYTAATLHDSAMLNEFGIGIRCVTENIAINNHSFSFCNYAMAKCEGDYTISLDTLKKVSVRTLKDFDASHLAGSDVTLLFNYLSREIKDSKTIIKNNPVPESLINLSTDSWQSLLLIQKPELDPVVQFEVSLLLTNGTIYRDTTSLIKIN